MNANQFRDIRLQSAKTQMQLADWLGIHWRTVQKYESGELKVPGPVDRAMSGILTQRRELEIVS